MPIARKARIFWPVLLLVVLADCTSKELAETHLVPFVPEPVVGDVVRLTLAYNPGAALSISLGPYSRYILSATALLALAFFAGLYRKTDSRQTLTVLALGLVMAGALGNLLDRLRSSRGVIDFIDIGLGSVRFWTFNIADVGVFVGALLLPWQLSRTPDADPA